MQILITSNRASLQANSLEDHSCIWWAALLHLCMQHEHSPHALCPSTQSAYNAHTSAQGCNYWSCDYKTSSHETTIAPRTSLPTAASRRPRRCFLRRARSSGSSRTLKPLSGWRSAEQILPAFRPTPMAEALFAFVHCCEPSKSHVLLRFGHRIENEELLWLAAICWCIEKLIRTSLRVPLSFLFFWN